MNNCVNNMNKQLTQSIIVFNENIDKSIENNEISKSVKRLLSSLQSVAKKFSLTETSSSLSSDPILTGELTKCLSKLEQIVLFEDSFPETSVLSGLAIGFALNLYICDPKRAIHLYFKLFLKQKISENFKDYKIDNDLNDVLTDSETINDLSKVSLLTGILNCNYFIDYVIELKPTIFEQIHCHTIRILNQRLLHQFHVFKLLQHWFTYFNKYCRQLSVNQPNLLDNRKVITDTLIQIDNNWEHPINGVKDCIKVVYQLILETFSTFKSLVSKSGPKDLPIISYDLIAEEVIKTSRLALTSKAKYRKMSALIPIIGWQTVVETDPNLSSQMLKFLSINSLSTAIIELYKAIINSMKMDINEDIIDVWSKYFLDSMCCALKSKNKVIHNNLLAHLLPFTLRNVENSTQLIFENLKNSRSAEVALIRAAVDHNLNFGFSPEFSWFKSVLMNSEEMVREEGLSLLIDERYITDRNQVFELFQLFLLSNLNVDNPSFRQRIVSKIDKFLNKVCISLSDKFNLHGYYDQSDQKSIQFLKNYIIIISSNMISGSSFQRRTTCLLLFDSLLTISSKNNLNFENYMDINDTYFLILLSIIDKDDKIRKMATNLLIRFQKTFMDSIEIDLKEIAKIGLYFLNSPRHQESHSGGLIMKYMITCFDSFQIEDKNIRNELELIEFFVKSAKSQLELSKTNPLVSAKTYPIHGFILALNNCISFEILKNFSDKSQLKNIINESIELCFECIELMLKQLSKSNIDSNPSFQEMCESLETVITNQTNETEDTFDDISISNDFQLLLSMCWLNIKECSFLLSNWTQLTQQFENTIISDSIVHKIGYQLINILSKCRHKGVIEATCIALTSFTVSLIKGKTRSNQNIQTLNQLLTDSLNCITKSALTSSITRRSAGLALTIQAILAGESEAFGQGFKLDKSLFSQTIDQLIETANLELPQNIDIKSDLPQTYALHILQSIVSTASLSRFTIQVVEYLLPICIKGFSSDIWQIRNASLQLFGSCCCRTLGQRKISDVDQLLTEGSTITYYELFSRYPTLLETFKIQFEESFKKIESGFFSTELVPVLSLFASFSPICLGEPLSDRQLLSYLIKLLSNRIWKIRMLSAKALTALLPINQLENLLLELSSQQNLNCNSIHGLMLSINHLLELKQQNNDNDFQQIKDLFKKRFEKFVSNNQNCYVLTDVYKEIFCDNTLLIDFCGQDMGEQNSNHVNRIDCISDEFLTEIYSNVEFTNSDDIRLFAAKSLNKSLNQISPDMDSSDIILKIVDILLVILEDEDRTVRSEAEDIASKLIKPNESQDSMSYNVLADNLLIWLNDKQDISPQKLTDYYSNKLESVPSISQLFESQSQKNHVLFEKEEKNVFAEPLFVSYKIAECLKKVISKHLTKINEKSLENLLNDCDIFLDNISILDINSLVRYSIWKLPKLFICLNNLYLRIDVLFHSILCKSNQTQISSINKSFECLKIIDNNFEEYLSTQTSDLLTPEVMVKLCRTYRLLSSKFGFFSDLKRNCLYGFSLFNFDI